MACAEFACKCEECFEVAREFFQELGAVIGLFLLLLLGMVENLTLGKPPPYLHDIADALIHEQVAFGLCNICRNIAPGKHTGIVPGKS